MRLETPRLALATANPASRLKAPGWATGVGLLALACYLLLLPFINRTWRTTGDEPHYLLAAHSLVTDLDYDLANNYANHDYLAFYFSQDITPQVRLAPGGQQILSHYPALPFLIAPAYALGGRFGVLLFQTLLGGLLAGLTFKLSWQVSRDYWASLLATACIVLTPPLLLYPYLIYPELIAALLVTATLYHLITLDRPTPTAGLVILLSLVTLPWLNRRFVPLALILALLVLWSWRYRAHPAAAGPLESGIYSAFRRIAWRSYFTPLGLAALLVTLLSLGLLAWFNSQLQAPARVDVTLPVAPGAIWLRLVRGIGWLLDQQRGLFIYGPVYLATLWGLPVLLARSWQARNRHWLILLPFFLSLALTTLAGGFWIAWEAGPRYLVVALPALAPLLALAWSYYRRWLPWRIIFLLLVGLSLLNSRAIIQNPELPYKSSLALFYGDWLGLPITDWLPDLADYANLAPRDLDLAEAGIERTEQAGQPVWFVPAGRPLTVIDPDPLYAMPYGHYLLSWPLRPEVQLPPETELARLSINLLGGGLVLNQVVRAADLAGQGDDPVFETRFLNPNVDRWRTPMVLRAGTSGQAALRFELLRLRPDPFYALFLPYLYLGLLLGGALLSWYWLGGTSTLKTRPITPPGSASPPEPAPGRPGKIGWLFLLAPLLAGLYLVYLQSRPSHTYEASIFYHLAGQEITDPAARDQRAWQVDPAIDPPQKAIYGPFDFYEAGLYQVTFRIKLPAPAEPEQELARLQVNATANFEELLAQPLLARHFSKIDLYHDMVLTIQNPRRQALSFEVYYLAVAPLVIDEVTVTRIEQP